MIDSGNKLSTFSLSLDRLTKTKLYYIIFLIIKAFASNLEIFKDRKMRIRFSRLQNKRFLFVQK